MAETVETLRVQLNYPLDRVKEPILFHLVTDFELVPDIRRANIDVHSGGFIEMDLAGTSSNIRRGLDWLTGVGVTVASAEAESDISWSHAAVPDNT